MAICPFCAESIPNETRICPLCDADLNKQPRQPQGGYSDLANDAGMRMLMPVGRSGWAIAAGYFGLLSFIVFPAPIALILGAVAVWDLKKHPHLHGWGRALFGLIMGALGTLIITFALIGALLGH